jgi:hypothetical protein
MSATKPEASMKKKAFELDPLVPSQFFETVRRRASNKNSEVRLLFAVLRDAVDCFQMNTPHADRHFKEAEQWIMGKNEQSDAVLTFEYVCSVLDLDPEYLRNGLRRWRAALDAQ